MECLSGLGGPGDPHLISHRTAGAARKVAQVPGDGVARKGAAIGATDESDQSRQDIRQSHAGRAAGRAFVGVIQAVGDDLTRVRTGWTGFRNGQVRAARKRPRLLQLNRTVPAAGFELKGCAGKQMRPGRESRVE